MNLFCRSLGGAASDYGNQIAGMRGRLWVQTLTEGALLVVFSRQTSIPGAMVCLVLFSSFVQGVEGMTFGIVPYVDPANTGAVCAVVGAWGNIGAVLWGYLFREGYATNFADGYLTLGFIIMCTAPFSALVKIPGHTSLFSSAEYKGLAAEKHNAEQDKRIEALEAIAAKHE